MLLERISSSITPVDIGRHDVSLSLSHNASVTKVKTVSGLDVLEINNSEEDQLILMLEVPLADSVGFWHPDALLERTVRPDWAGARTTSIVRSAPFGSLYNDKGESLLSFGIDRMVGEVSLEFGVAEEEKSFLVLLEIVEPIRDLRLAIGRDGSTFLATIEDLKSWLGGIVGKAPLLAPDFATQPVYSTWYSFGQDISAPVLEAEAYAARALGMRSMFIDDGWQKYGSGRLYAGCGDWIADEEKFPDFSDHVRLLQQIGLKVVLWVAPLLLGENCDRFDQLASLAPLYKSKLECRIIDPRVPAARDHMVASCVRLMSDYGLDGLKIDFLDDAMDYKGTEPTAGSDFEDVGLAMESFLSELREALAEAGHSEPLIEFRQPYVSPALAPYANVLRAIDCPADSVMNRTGVADARLASRNQIIHSDMLMWGQTEGARAAALQLIGAFFGVPQISMRLLELTAEEQEAVSSYLQLWRDFKELVVDGQFEPSLPHTFYPQLRMSLGRRLLIALYQREVVDVDLDVSTDVVVLNGSAYGDLVIDSRGSSDVKSFASVFGPTGASISAGSIRLSRGLQRLEVPSGGYARIQCVDH